MAQVSRSTDNDLSGWQVICWALVIALMPLLVAAWWLVLKNIFLVPFQAWLAPWLGFLYVTMFSQLLGFFFWNKGHNIGGVARVSQVQLVIPFVTICASALLLDEPIDSITIFLPLWCW